MWEWWGVPESIRESSRCGASPPYAGVLHRVRLAVVHASLQLCAACLHARRPTQPYLPLHIWLWLYDQVKLKLEALQEEEKEAEEEEAEEEKWHFPADFRRYHDGACSLTPAAQVRTPANIRGGPPSAVK